MNTIDQFQIEIQNSQTQLAIDESQLESAISFLLQSEQVTRAEIQLNQQYLAHDYDTDVLSFLLDCDTALDSTKTEFRGAGKQIEGEVIVSAEMAVAMSAEYDWSAEQELLLYVIHGLLHLCGYDDLTEEELRIMRKREQQIFDHWQITIPRREE